VSGPVGVSRSTTLAFSLVGIVFHGGTPIVAMLSGEPLRAKLSVVALSPVLMLVVSMTSVLPSQWPTLLPSQASTGFGQCCGSPLRIGITRVPSISSAIVT
jgi:hypothetical protein